MTEFENSLLHHVLQSMADRAAAEGPSAKAIVDAADGTGLSLADLAATAANVAREWRRGGVRHGDTVTLFLPNMAEFYVPVLAAWLCGAAVSCTDPDIRALTLARQVKLTGQSVSHPRILAVVTAVRKIVTNSVLRIRIRDPVPFLPLDPGSGIRDEQPGSYFLELRNHFFGFKIFKGSLT